LSEAKSRKRRRGVLQHASTSIIFAARFVGEGRAVLRRNTARKFRKSVLRCNSYNMLRCSCSRLRRKFRKSVECLHVRKSAVRLTLLKSVLRRSYCNMLQRAALNPRVLPLVKWHSYCNMLQHAAQTLKQRGWRQRGRRRVYAEMFYYSVLGFQLL
jgi:hypothetical protein